MKTGQNFRVPASVRCTTSKVTSLHSWHQETPCTNLLKPNVTQYRSGSTVNVNCNGCKSNNATINVLFLQNQAFRKEMRTYPVKRNFTLVQDIHHL